MAKGARRTSEAKKIEDRVNKAYNASCNGIEISIMDMPKIWAFGKKLAYEGADDETLQTKIKEFVTSIAKP